VADNSSAREVTLERITVTAFPGQTQGSSRLTLIKGNEQHFLAVGEYSNGYSKVLSEDVSAWQSSDTKVADFSQPGVLKGRTSGNIKVYFTKDSLTSNEAEVSVSDPSMTAIRVTPSRLSIAKGQSEPLTATAIYSDNTSSDISDSVSWLPVDSTTASVTSQGLLSGDNVGSTSLTAVKNGVTSNAVDVNITDAVMTAIRVTPATVNVAKGHTESMTAKAIYSDGTSSDISDSVNWLPANTTTASVTSQGVLRGDKVGVTTLTATINGVISNPVGVVVSSAVITGISVTPPTVTVAKGQNQPLTARATYSDLTSSDVSRFVTWSPIDNSTATVTLGGLLTGANVGTTSVTASKDGVTSNTVSVDVSDAVITALRVTPSVVSVAKGEEQPLTATAKYSDDTSSDVSDSVTWTSFSSAVSASPLSVGFTAPAYVIASVTPQGVLTGDAIGATTVTASIDGITSNTVDVDVTDATLTEISVKPTAVRLAKGQKEPLTATATYSDGTSSNISDSVTWIPVDSTTAGVTAQGLLTGGTVGTTTLTAVKNGITSNTIDIDITNAVITSIGVTPTTISVAKGQSEPLTAIATYSDNTSSNISATVSWIPVDTNTATVTSEGLLTGGDAGTTTLTAAKDGIISNSVDVDVTNAVMTGLTFSPPLIGVIKGQTQPITASATYSDGTSSDVSDSVTWWTPAASSNAMSVTADGLVTGLNAGSSTITASKNGFTNSIEVNVCNLDSSGLTGKCLDIFDTGNGKWFTSTPSVAYLDSLGLGGSRYTEGTDRGGMFYKFNWTKAKALCTEYNPIKLGGRSNWRLPTVDELSSELYAFYGVSPMIRDKLSTERGWTLETHHWSISPRSETNDYWSVYMYNNWRSSYIESFKFFVSCVSEP